MILSDLIEHAIIWKTSPSKWQALKELSALLFEKGAISDFDAFTKALVEREKIVSTGIGIGVAVPHARLPSLDKFVLALGVAQDRGIDWDAMDKKPVQLVFAIGAPINAPQEYIQLLSSITACVKNPVLRKKMIKIKSQKDLIELLAKKRPKM